MKNPLKQDSRRIIWFLLLATVLGHDAHAQQNTITGYNQIVGQWDASHRPLGRTSAGPVPALRLAATSATDQVSRSSKRMPQPARTTGIAPWRAAPAHGLSGWVRLQSAPACRPPAPLVSSISSPRRARRTD